MTITEFLEARIEEDERRANYYGPLAMGTARVLAECAAKQAIIGMHRRTMDIYGDALGDTCTTCVSSGPDAQGYPCDTLKALAAVYADHPDYKQEWAK